MRPCLRRPRLMASADIYGEKVDIGPRVRARAGETGLSGVGWPRPVRGTR